MPFQLYKNDHTDPPRRPISFDDLDDKAFWCRHGEQQEQAFVSVMSKITSAWEISIHPAKAHNPYHPDLLCIDKTSRNELVGEVKVKNSPLFFAKKQYRVPSQYALTMDLKDSFNYSALLAEGVDILIFIWVRWEAHEMETSFRGQTRHYYVNPMKGVWSIPFSRLRAFELAHPPPIHWYSEPFRQPDLTDGDSEWGAQLAAFDERLVQADGRVKNISSKGFLERNGRRYPSGHSSGSYVFNLKQADLFDEIVFWQRREPWPG